MEDRAAHALPEELARMLEDLQRAYDDFAAVAPV
jgi:hypothetical protein